MTPFEDGKAINSFCTVTHNVGMSSIFVTRIAEIRGIFVLTLVPASHMQIIQLIAFEVVWIHLNLWVYL